MLVTLPGKHHNKRITPSSRNTKTSFRTGAQTEHPRIQPRLLSTNSRQRNGLKTSPGLCKHIHGAIGEINARHQQITNPDTTVDS